MPVQHSIWSSLKNVSSILGPLLFLLFINDLPLNVDAKCHIYADDVQLYRSSDILSIENSINLLNKDIRKLVKWSIFHGISINSSKSQAILIAPRQINWNSVPITVAGGNEIPFISKVRNLGLIIYENFTWIDHISEMCKKINLGLRKLWACFHITPLTIRKRLVLTLILPLFTYSDVIFSQSLTSSCQRRLKNTLFNSCANTFLVLGDFFIFQVLPLK